MKTLCLFILALTLTFSGFSQNKEKYTEVVNYTFDNWSMMVMCDGTYVGDLVGTVSIKAVNHYKTKWTLDIVSGVLEGTGNLEGESFEIKFHGKYFNNWWEPNFEVELHFVAKGDNGTKIIARGYYSPATGPVSLKSKCM